MCARGGIIASYESAVTSKPLPDPVVVEDSQGYGRLSNSARTNESD